MAYLPKLVVSLLHVIVCGVGAPPLLFFALPTVESSLTGGPIDWLHLLLDLVCAVLLLGVLALLLVPVLFLALAMETQGNSQEICETKTLKLCVRSVQVNSQPASRLDLNSGHPCCCYSCL